MTHTEVKETVKNGITEVVLQEGENIRAVAYINSDRSGKTQLQTRTSINRNWVTLLTEPKTADEIKYSLHKAGKHDAII